MISPIKKTTLCSLIILHIAATCCAQDHDTVTIPAGKQMGQEFIALDNEDDRVQLNVSTLAKGQYTCFLNYAVSHRGGGRILIELNDQKINEKIKPTGSLQFAYCHDAGTYKHKGGRLDITITVLDKDHDKKDPVLNLHSVVLKPK